MENKQTKKDKVRDLLLGVEREGMKEFVQYLDDNNFWTCPGSTKFHGNYKGGLLDHCYNLYNLFWKHLQVFKINFPKSSQIICAFGHDICKIGAYIQNPKPEGFTGYSYSWNRMQPPGHAKLSIEILERYITLTPEEKEVIKYHMGMYSTIEFLGTKGEYNVKELVGVYNTNKVAKLFYFCDDMVAQFVDDKK